MELTGDPSSSLHHGTTTAPFFSPDEETRWKQSVRWEDIPSQRTLVLIVGPAGAGKSFLLESASKGEEPGRTLLRTFSRARTDATASFEQSLGGGDSTDFIGMGFKLADFVLLDGDGMREQRRLSAPVENSSHEAMKPVVAAFKRKMIQEGVGLGKNFLLPLTFSTDENWEQLKLFGIDCATCASGRDTTMLRSTSNSYMVRHIFLVLAPYEVLLDRIEQRGARTGRSQTMGREKFDQAIDGIRILLKHPRMNPTFVYGIRLIHSGNEGAGAGSGRIIFDYRRGSLDEIDEVDDDDRMCIKLSGENLPSTVDVLATLDLALDLFESEETKLKRFLVRQYI